MAKAIAVFRQTPRDGALVRHYSLVSLRMANPSPVGIHCQNERDALSERFHFPLLPRPSDWQKLRKRPQAGFGVEVRQVIALYFTHGRHRDATLRQAPDVRHANSDVVRLSKKGGCGGNMQKILRLEAM